MTTKHRSAGTIFAAIAHNCIFAQDLTAKKNGHENKLPKINYKQSLLSILQHSQNHE